MKLKETIELAARSADRQNNFLTDGQQSCSYQEMPRLLEQIDRSVRAHGILIGDCVAFECANTLFDALALLYLLAYRHHFVLLPRVDDGKSPANSSDQADAAPTLKPVPHFCQYRIAVDADGVEQGQSPGDRLRIGLNPQYNGLRVAEAHHLPEGAVYLRTSGSMGTSKIVVHNHDNLLGNARNCVEKYGYAAEDRLAIPVPIAHMYGGFAAFLPAILVGASVDLQEKSNLLKYLGREKRFQPNVAYVTPALCSMLLQAFKSPRSYKFIVTSGQRINEQLFRDFDARVGGCLVNQYGSSEMGAIAACSPREPVEVKERTIGQPMKGVELRIANPESESNAGELQCRHPFGYEGYVDEAGDWLTQRVSDGWYATGDLAKQDDRGDISVVGRVQNSVNRDGYLILLSDIERIMEQFEQIEQVVVVASTEENRRGPRLTAFCVPTPDSALESQHVRAICFDRLPKYAVPDDVRLVDALPLLPSGKVDQRRLKAMAEVSAA